MKKFAFFLPVLCATLAYAQHDSAALFHGDELHRGNYSSDEYGAFGDLKWKFKTGGKIFGSPALYNGYAFVGSEDHFLYAINISNKKLAWKFATGGAVHSTPAVFENVVYFSSGDGYYYAVAAISGKLKWKFKTTGERQFGAKGLWGMKPLNEHLEDPFDLFLSSPVINKKDLIIYFGSGDGKIYALNIKDGSLVWKFSTNGIVHTSPALCNGNVYIGSWDSYFYALDAKTGKEKWKFKSGEDSVYHLMGGIQSSATISDGMVCFGARDGYFHALDIETGKELWKYSANGSWILATAAVKNNTFYFGTSDSRLFVAVDAATGKEKYHAQANGYVFSSPCIAGSTAYFGDFTGQLLAVDISADGKIIDKYQTPGRKINAAALLNKDTLEFQYLVKGMDLSFYAATVEGMKKLYLLGPIASSPVIYNGNIYFGSADGCLYSVSLKKK